MKTVDIPVIKIGFATGKQGQTPINRAVSMNIHNLISGTFTDFEYSLENLVISRGNLTPIYVASVEGAICWEMLLKDLRKRGLQSVELFVADGIWGLEDAVDRVFGQVSHSRIESMVETFNFCN